MADEEESMSASDREAERLARLMDKKANEKFEQARKDALKKYQQQGGNANNFQLKSESTAPTEVKKEGKSASNWRADLEVKEREQKLRYEEEERKKRERIAQSVVYEAPSESHSSVFEREEPKRQVEPDEQPKGKSELQLYNERLEREQAALKSRLEEEERRKREAMKTLVTCFDCKSQVELPDSVKHNNILYCRSCGIKAQQPKGPKCAQCTQPIFGSFITAMGKKYHPECMVCSACGKNIEGGFRNVFNKMWCVDCRPVNR